MRYAIALFIVLLASVVAAQAIDRARLIGAWENAGPNFTQTQTFNDDGSFQVKIKSDIQMMNREESGQWELVDSTLKLVVEKSTTEGRAGKSGSFKVHRVTDDELVIQKNPADPNETVTFKRVK